MQAESKLEEIDDGHRQRWRFNAPSIGAAIVRVAMEVERRCPEDCYPLHVSIKKNPRGARADATVIYQVRSRPLPVKRGGILLPRR